MGTAAAGTARPSRLLFILFSHYFPRKTLGIGWTQVDREVDLGGGESGDFEVEPEIQRLQFLELDLQDLGIVSGIFRQLVVG